MVSVKDKFLKKHGPGAEPDPIIAQALTEYDRNGAMACAAAFEVASALNAAPGDVGRTADLSGYRLTHCQLGLFGHPEKGKNLSPAPAPEPALEAAIRSAMEGDRLACAAAWRIAEERGMPRLRVGRACEAMGVKVKPCQLGAF